MILDFMVDWKLLKFFYVIYIPTDVLEKKYHQRIGSLQSLVAFWHGLYLKIIFMGQPMQYSKEVVRYMINGLEKTTDFYSWATTLTVYQTIKQRGHQILRRWQLASKLMSAKQYVMGIRTINTRNNAVVSVTFVYVSTCKYIDNK